jgi:hypothetical protein
VTWRAIAAAALALGLVGCVSVSMIGMHCRKLEIGIDEYWLLITAIECTPSKPVEGPLATLAVPGSPDPDPAAPSPAGPLRPSP